MDKAASSTIAGSQLRKRKHINVMESDDVCKENNDTLASGCSVVAIVKRTVSLSASIKQPTVPNVKQDCLDKLVAIGRERFAKITRLRGGQIRVDIRKYENKEKQMECEGSAAALLKLLKTAGIDNEADHICAEEKSKALSETYKGVSLSLYQLDKLLPILQRNKTLRWAEGSIRMESEHHCLGGSLYAFCFSKSPDTYRCLELRHCCIDDDGVTLLRSKTNGINMNDDEAVNLLDILEAFHRIINAGYA